MENLTALFFAYYVFYFGYMAIFPLPVQIASALFYQ